MRINYYKKSSIHERSSKVNVQSLPKFNPISDEVIGTASICEILKMEVIVKI